MADLGIHKTDLIQFLTGRNVVEVQASLATLDKTFADGSPITVDDNAICIYRLEGNILGTMTASWTDYAGEDNSTVLFGTEGVLRIYEDPAHSLVLQKRGGGVEYFDVDQIQTNDQQTRSGVIDLFIDHLLDPKKPCISGESVLNAMRAVFAARESSLTGRAIKISE
jgi:predicted dehydrogenase